MFAAVAMVGLLIVLDNTRSDAELRSLSQQAIERYVPFCDGERMRPGDSCVVLGGAPDDGGPYDEMVQKHRRAHTPEALDERYGMFRGFGYAVIGVGLLLALVALVFAAGSGGHTRRLDAEVAKLPAESAAPVVNPPAVLFPPAGRSGERPPGSLGSFLWLLVTVAVLVALMWWTSGTNGVLGGGLAGYLGIAITLLFVWSAAGSAAGRWRSRSGRARWARAHEHLYLRRDPGLLDRLGIGVLHPSGPDGHNVVYGVHEGTPFVIFDHDTERGRVTTWVTALAVQPPPLRAGVVRGSTELLQGAATEWQALWPAVRPVADLHLPAAAGTDGSIVWEAGAAGVAFTGPQLGRRLHGLRQVGRAIVAAVGVPGRR